MLKHLKAKENHCTFSISCIVYKCWPTCSSKANVQHSSAGRGLALTNSDRYGNTWSSEASWFSMHEAKCHWTGYTRKAKAHYNKGPGDINGCQRLFNNSIYCSDFPTLNWSSNQIIMFYAAHLILMHYITYKLIGNVFGTWPGDMPNVATLGSIITGIYSQVWCFL